MKGFEVAFAELWNDVLGEDTHRRDILLDLFSIPYSNDNPTHLKEWFELPKNVKEILMQHVNHRKLNKLYVR